MPFYDFRCNQCENVFTIRATIKEKEAGLMPSCPNCHSFETQQVITTGVLLGQAATGNDRSLSFVCCGPGAGSGCCG